MATSSKNPGIIGMKYNKALRLFETTLINDKKGPDISVDALIAKDTSVTEFISKTEKAKLRQSTSKSNFDELDKKVKATESEYNAAIANMSNIIDEIEKKVTK